MVANAQIHAGLQVVPADGVADVALDAGRQRIASALATLDELARAILQSLADERPLLEMVHAAD